MNKNAIKKFAIEARKKLIASVSDKAGMLGITSEGCSEPVSKGVDFEVYKTIAGTEITLGKSQCEQRRKLKEKVESRGFEAVVEEVAYTWFNRICAIRFMEVNDYLPTRVRVLSSEKEGKNEPDIVTQAPDVDLDFTDKEREYILDCKMNNKLDELFKMLFVKQCNKLSEILPELFEATEDYTEMLLNISYTNKDDIIYMLVNQETGITEADFNVSTINEDGQPTGQVEIIGWLYQYYNTEPKAEIFARTSGTKIKKEDIPAATQLFTPDWIVRYMVENSVGRIWIEGHPNDNLKDSWNYYIDEAEQEPEVVEKYNEIKETYKGLSPETFKVIDPCMGSGHILVYAFDVLMRIYESYGYTQRDAARSILQNNIFGLDIDERAYQLAYFAVMMKARYYNRRIFAEKIEPNLCFIKSSKALSEDALNKMGGYKQITQRLIAEFRDADEYGSIMSVSLSETDLQNISDRLEVVKNNEDISNLMDIMDCNELVATLTPLLKQAKILGQKYEVVVTNPPYLTVSATTTKLVDYVKKNYPDSKTDLFAVFIERCNKMLKPLGYQAMITMHSWMFLSSYENLRNKLLMSNFVNMAHLGARAFEEIGGEVVQTTAFIIRNCYIPLYNSVYCRLLSAMSQSGKEMMFLQNQSRYISKTDNYNKITGSPFAYWLSEQVRAVFLTGTPLGTIAAPRKGNSTSDNNRFLRLWHEVSKEKMNIGNNIIDIEDSQKRRWYPYNKGGGYRKWYGYNEYLIDWYNDAYEIRNIKTAVIANYQYFMKPGLTWSTLSSNSFSIRWFDEGYIFDNGGCCIFELGNKRPYIASLLNSSVFKYIFGQLNPTLNFQSGEVAKFPVIFSDNTRIDDLALENVALSKAEYDSFETSWDFKKHPLVQYASFEPQEIIVDKARHISDMGLIRDAYEIWKDNSEQRFNKLKANEEELNRIFINIYGLQDELTPDVEDKDVTVRKADLQREIKSLLSYAVGCMFGRYSLDCEGIAYAGGEWEDSKYETFIPDKDNCIPITDEEYFEDDIVGRLCEWLKTVYGAEILEENLDFIAKALGNKGNTSREIIRNYFINDFMKDHMKIYQKRPIYWLFNSGKANGFKALVYMHRYNSDTVAKVRVDYLHNVQKSIEQAKLSAEYLRDNGSGAEKAKATKLITKYTKQLAEIHLYDEAMAHIANQRIDIDLDDGVKVNYEKFQGVEVAQEGKKALKVDLLAKIK